MKKKVAYGRKKAKWNVGIKSAPKTGLKSGLEMKIYGVRSCQAIFAKRPQDIIRLYISPDLTKNFSDLLKFCAKEKKAYHTVDDQKLEQIVASNHHEGIAMVVKKRKEVSETEFLRKTKMISEPIIYFDGVGNPHNVGAIMRTMAHFGLSWILGGGEDLPDLSPSAARISEGASEHVELVKLRSPKATLLQLKKEGWELVGTSSHLTHNLYEWKPQKKTILLLGAESTGMTAELEEICDKRIAILGTGLVESLNVSVATGIIAAHLSQGKFT